MKIQYNIVKNCSCSNLFFIWIQFDSKTKNKQPKKKSCLKQPIVNFVFNKQKNSTSPLGIQCSSKNRKLITKQKKG